MSRDAILRAWVIFSWVCVIGFTVAWPVTALTIFRHEPQGILGLSYLALIIASLGNLIAVLVLVKVDDAT
jgi:hypothetical protein